MLSSMLNLVQLQVAVAAAKRQFGLIRKKYPELKAYLVYSLPGGQTEIESNPKQILEEFPAMVVDDISKSKALNLQSSIELLEWKGTKNSELDRQKTELDQLVTKLNYDEKCQVELRFLELNYDLIWKLQADELVERKLTPKTKASIQIVLGTLGHFGRSV